MAAAVADFRSADPAAVKIKKDAGTPRVALERTADVLAELVRDRRPGQVVVGFAAETGDDAGDWLAHGRKKLAAKGCDLLVVNPVGAGRAFGTPDNTAVVLGADGAEVEVPPGPKAALAAVVWDLVADRL
jgi:phosphopantothenoylcysteine decarboxylase/phosphopantothenate--cysteine ligase